MNVYVYYDVPVPAATAMLVKIEAMQAMLVGRASRIGLLRRQDDESASTTLQTWMEIYEDVTVDFDAQLARVVALHAPETGKRHVERFERIG